MAVYSKHLLSSKEKIAIVMVTFFSLISWFFPGVGAAYAKADGQEQTQVFEIKSTISLGDLENQDQTLQLEQQQQQLAQVDKEVTLVRDYLEAKNSPLSTYTEYLMAQDDWKTIIAVSNAESGMGKHCYVNNCGGVGGITALKTYRTVPDWIQDMQNIINKRYKGMTLNQMDGVYVQPRSTNWLIATSSVYQDLSNIEKQFSTQS